MSSPQDKSNIDMPLPNGVDPTGTIQNLCPSAAWLGNRGEIHDAEGRIVHSWKIKASVTCQLSYKGWSRQPLMQPGSYTELLFLDEATALSTGHRPCGMCRKPQYVSFKAHWLAANGHAPDLGIAEIDKLLNAEHTNRGTTGDWTRSSHTLPAGVFVECDGAPHPPGTEMQSACERGGASARSGCLSRSVRDNRDAATANAKTTDAHASRAITGVRLAHAARARPRKSSGAGPV